MSEYEGLNLYPVVGPDGYDPTDYHSSTEIATLYPESAVDWNPTDSPSALTEPERDFPDDFDSEDTPDEPLMPDTAGETRPRLASDPAAARLGQRLRKARLARNLTQSEVAQQRFSVSYLRAVERGQIRPSLGALEKLSERLRVPLTEILGRECDPNCPTRGKLAIAAAEAAGDLGADASAVQAAMHQAIARTCNDRDTNSCGMDDLILEKQRTSPDQGSTQGGDE